MKEVRNISVYWTILCKKVLVIYSLFLLLGVVRNRIDSCMRCDDMLLYLSNYPLFVLCDGY